MRVLHLTRDFPPHANGGLSSAVGGLVAAQHQAGLSCAVLSFDAWRPHSTRRAGRPPRCADEDGTLVLRVHDPSQAAAAIPRAARWRPELCHVHHDMLWRFIEALREAGVTAPACCTVHVLHAAMNRLRGITEPTLSLRGQQRALAEADAVIAPSRSAVRLLLEDDPGLEKRLVHIGFGARPEESEQPQEERARNLLYAGRFADVKGTAELFSAAAELLDGDPELELVLAGGNPESPRSERRWLRRLERSVPAPARDRVRFCGWLGAEALAHEYRRATALLAPSWIESFGLAALEAMAHGTPVVASAVAALEELVQHRETGLLVPVGDARALAAAAGQLLEQPDLAQFLGAAARRRVGEHYSWSAVAEEHRRLYTKLRSSRRSS